MMSPRRDCRVGVNNVFLGFLIPGFTQLAPPVLFAVKRVFYFYRLDSLLGWLSMSCPFQALSVKIQF